MIYNTGSGWDFKDIFTGTVVINDVCIGELDSSFAGNEIAVTDNLQRCLVLYCDGGTWKNTVAATLTSPTGRLAIGDFDSANPGNEIAMGSLNMVYEVFGSGSSWSSADIWYANSTVSDLAVGDFFSGNSGDEIAVGHQALEVAMVTGSGTTWSNATLYTNPDSIAYKTVVAGEFDSVHSGIEIVAVTNIGRMFEIAEGTLPTPPPVPEIGIFAAAIPIVIFMATALVSYTPVRSRRP
jgi:hypothetical protein